MGAPRSVALGADLDAHSSRTCILPALVPSWCSKRRPLVATLPLHSHGGERRTGEKRAVDQALITEAERVFGLSDLRPFAPSGQKYVARALRAGGDVVLKVVELVGTHKDVTLERARREVDLLSRIHHDHVVQVLSGLEDLGGRPVAGVAWLEEFLDGEDLRDRLSSPWTWRDTHAMALEVAQGLAAMHAERTVHRDLSPGNIRCTSAGHFVIMDPGLARHIEESTLTGLFQPGTPGFMTPEHAAMTRPTPASDVFAVGILMYLALTGDLPIPVGGDFDRYRIQLRDQQAPSLGALRADLAAEQIALVDRCLQRQSARRFLDGADLAAELEKL